jgi:L,D-transpeptidase YcbB
MHTSPPLRIAPVLTFALLATAMGAVPAHAQKTPKKVQEDTRVYVPDIVEDAAPTQAEQLAEWPRWTAANAGALLAQVEAADAQALFARDYDPTGLAAAIASGEGDALNKRATETFLLLATHRRDGRTPNAARKQWFVVDSDAGIDLFALLDSALASGDIGGALDGLDPVHANFAALKTALAATKPADKARADKLRVNMERWRWMPRDLGQRHILTNVPEYMTRVVNDGVVIATHKAVVGKPATATPQLDAKATAIILNPTWTLPRSIIDEGIGATIATNPQRARAQGYTWTGKGKSLSVVQSAGPGNALGVMKLEMLNPHAIYLHDTPSKGAFGAEARAFSHGCIRTERALHFYGLMAVIYAGRSPEEFGEAIAGGKTTRMEFAEPFPVFIGYWTAAPKADGQLAMMADIYGRDVPVIAAFAKPGRPAAARIVTAPAPTTPAVTDSH